MTLRLARTLAGRRLFPGAAAIVTTDRVAQTAPSSHATLPGWSIDRRKICDLLGAGCIAPDHLWASVAI
jgi:hypothetical protein